MSKHEDIIKHIKSLDIGTKISVRGIATALNVSEGTAYRAIKDCDSAGIASTIPRVGTIRTDKIVKKEIKELTYQEIMDISNGTLMGGNKGIQRTLNKFVIGAMTIDAMEKYIRQDCLLIVGNREEAQRLALTKGAAVLITGGFKCSEDIKKLADEKELPIISSTYDTFTIATLINKAMSENSIKKDIIFVSDIMNKAPISIKGRDTIKDFRKLKEVTRHTKYPVVDENRKLIGIITLKQIPEDTSDDELVSRYMIKNPLTISPENTVAYVAHIMGGEGIELCPVVTNKKLIGIINRKDVILALKYMARQPQTFETLESKVINNFQLFFKDNKACFSGKIIPEMMDTIGTASWGSLNLLLSTMGIMALKQNNINITADSISTYFMKPVQIDCEITVETDVITTDRNFCKVEITMYDDKKSMVAKAMLSAKTLKK